MGYRWLSVLLAVFCSSTACLDREVYYDRPTGIGPAAARRSEGQPFVNTRDVLLVVDDSISMVDKHRVLRESLARANLHVTGCSDVSFVGGNPVFGASSPPEDGRCPEGTTLTNLLGLSPSAVITSSVGAGGIACQDQVSGARPLPEVPEEEVQASEVLHSQWYAQLGYLGETGCGYEAPLEAMYRFLVDPEPPLLITTTEGDSNVVSRAEGIDQAVLDAREKFLHPVSQLVILFLSDEDDCSVRDSERAWKVGAPAGLARATAVCESSPNDVCCRSCDTEESVPPAGCAALAEDPVCSTTPTWAVAEDPANLRCFKQKQRFGEDWLFPLKRYTDALTQPTITTRSGRVVDNPLFAHGRTPDMISVLALTGVPWQLLVTQESLDDDAIMQYLTPEQLEKSGVWSKLLGDLEPAIPIDPHLIASIEPRAGLAHPGDPLDPIHGHEVTGSSADDLQYSCIFELPEPRPCAPGQFCDCPPGAEVLSPLCRATDGSYGDMQRFAKAYPPPRMLEFLRSLGPRGRLGSICPRQLKDPSRAGFGYTDAALTLDRTAWDLSCFHPPLPVKEDGIPKCKLLELHEGNFDCEAAGRTTENGPFAEAMRLDLRVDLRKRQTPTIVCELPRLPGNPKDPSSPAFACAHELHPVLDGQVGYCYIDADLKIGNPSLVDFCVDKPSHRRRVRLIPQNLPLPGTSTLLVCDYRNP